MEIKTICFFCIAILSFSACNNPDGDKNISCLDPLQFKHYVDYFSERDTPPDGWTIKNDSVWGFMKDNIPFFECPDKLIEQTYYFRWWTFRKHLRDTPEGWVVTEFLEEKTYAGKYNVINCPAGHQIYEGRWLKKQEYIKDYISFYLTDPASKPRLFTLWLANSFNEFVRVHPDSAFEKRMLPLLVDNYNEWTKKRRDKGKSLYWTVDQLDGMEWTAGGQVLNDGLPKFAVAMTRPSINSYMYGDAMAIAELAEKYEETDLAKDFYSKADTIKTEVLNRLWNKDLNFFTTMVQDYDLSSKPVNVREQIGFIPWYFNLPPQHEGYETAWKQLMDSQGFYAPFGPTTCEQRSQYFKVDYTEVYKPNCQWNGPSWPFATTQTLVAMANLLNNYQQDAVSKVDYYKILSIYAKSHCFRQIKPDVAGLDKFETQLETKVDTSLMWIDESLDPFTGNWHTRYRLKMRNWEGTSRGKDYNHSGFCDLIISGLVGVRTSEKNELVVNPLIPDDWDYFCLDHLNYKNREVAIVWDKTGKKYKKGKGFLIFIDGKLECRSDDIQKITIYF